MNSSKYLLPSVVTSNKKHSPFLYFGRIRPALYFLCVLAITTSFYCLVLYEPNGFKSSAFSSINHLKHHQQNVAINSKTALLDAVVRDANRNFIENFRNKISPVPQTNYLEKQIFYEKTFGYDLIQKNKSATFNELDFRLKDDEFNFDYENVNISSTDHVNYQNKYLNKNANIDDDDDEDVDPNSIEHYLRYLGFDLHHISRLHKWSINETTFDKSGNIKTSIKPSNTNDKSTLNVSGGGVEVNSFYFYKNHNFLNRSSLFSVDFLSSIVFITTINSNQFNIGINFIRSFESFRNAALQSHFQKDSNSNVSMFNLIIYDLGLYPKQLTEIQTLCNVTLEQSISNLHFFKNASKKSFPLLSQKLCLIRKFQYEHYPSHLTDLKTEAYRSVIIQEVLRDIRRTIYYQKYLHRMATLVHKVGKQWKSKPTMKDSTTNISPDISVFWLDLHYQFIDTRHDLVQQLQKETLQTSGLMSWPIEQPTSSLTHPRMFEYFHITADNFYFHHMVRTGHLMISVNDSTWEQFQWGIMLPWVRCALTVDCIAPLGSQWRSSCQLDKKPHYRYSGCHHYDMSALNVVLGIAFNYSSSIYSATRSSRFFVPFYTLITTPKITGSVTNSVPYENYEPNQPNNDLLLDEWPNNSAEFDGRFDQILTDDDIPNEMKRPTSTSPAYLSSSSSAYFNFDSNNTKKNFIQKLIP